MIDKPNVPVVLVVGILSNVIEVHAVLVVRVSEWYVPVKLIVLFLFFVPTVPILLRRCDRCL